MSCQAAPRRHASATAKSTAKSGGGWGLTGTKNSFYFNNLLIPKVTPPSSNPSLSAKYTYKSILYRIIRGNPRIFLGFP